MAETPTSDVIREALEFGLKLARKGVTGSLYTQQFEDALEAARTLDDLVGAGFVTEEMIQRSAGYCAGGEGCLLRDSEQG